MALLPNSGAMRAGMRWLTHLRTEEVSRLRVLFTHHGRYSDLTPAQYADGLAWLRRIELVGRDGRLAPAVSRRGHADEHGLVAAVLEATCPSWLTSGDWPLNGSAELPREAVALAAALEITEADVGAAALAVRCQVDTSMRELVGAVGERELLALLRRSLDAEVRHVAAESDGYGYDIEVSGPRWPAVHLEVKTTTDRSRLVVYLSRHEYETMRRDGAWTMVAVLLGFRGELVATATVDPVWLLRARPYDSHAAARWESVRLVVPPHALRWGISGVCVWSRDAAATAVLVPEASHRHFPWCGASGGG
ncbi:protein NO VEIN domain-containing protein [Streptomyces syringium]|uniref:protein NO VEIN domain-containing protein n=1 Tax=Streptomyces syringium TaxID=76729 RepID=UPI003410DD5D